MTLPLVALGLLGIGNLLSVVGLLQLTLCIFPLHSIGDPTTQRNGRLEGLPFFVLFHTSFRAAASYNCRVVLVNDK